MYNQQSGNPDGNRTIWTRVFAVAYTRGLRVILKIFARYHVGIYKRDPLT